MASGSRVCRKRGNAAAVRFREMPRRWRALTAHADCESLHPDERIGCDADQCFEAKGERARVDGALTLAWLFGTALNVAGAAQAACTGERHGVEADAPGLRAVGIERPRGSRRRCRLALDRPARSWLRQGRREGRGLDEEHAAEHELERLEPVEEFETAGLADVREVGELLRRPEADEHEPEQIPRVHKRREGVGGGEAFLRAWRVVGVETRIDPAR